MGKQNKQEIHYLHLSGMGGGKEGWEKKKSLGTALPARPWRGTNMLSLAQRPASGGLGRCQPEGLGDTVPLFLQQQLDL